MKTKYFKRDDRKRKNAKLSFDWGRTGIYRTSDEHEYLEEYVKSTSEWYYAMGPWVRTPYYSKFAGTGKGSGFKQINEKQAFIELL